LRFDDRIDTIILDFLRDKSPTDQENPG
jgi:hypothetical protein